MTRIPIDPDSIRRLAAVLVETGLTEIEIAEKDSRIRVVRGAAPGEMVLAAAPAAVATAAAPAAAAPVAADGRCSRSRRRGCRRTGRSRARSGRRR